MIDAQALLTDVRRVTDLLVDDLRARTEKHGETRVRVRGVFEQAASAGRTDRSFEEWREDLLAQVASGWTLACVFVRFCEDNGLVDPPLLSGPGERRGIARDHRTAFFAENPTAGDREWLVEVFHRYQDLPGVSGVFGERNPLWQIQPSADGAKALLELWWVTGDEGRSLRHDFADPELGTRFLGDLYQDLSEHARKQFALLQTPDFIEEFILDRTLDPAIETFGLGEVRMIDPTCGSGHFLLGAFDRIVDRWQEREPGTPTRDLAQRALDAVNGVDINPFAVAIARFRMLVAALKVSEIRRLVDAPDFHINVATGDSLLHGTHGGRLFAADDLAEVVNHHYPHEDVELAKKILKADQYHAVVGNPPYITVKDPAMRDVYRSLYETCSGKYALSVPFVERFHDLAVFGDANRAAGFVGQITANSFMKREMGKKLVREWFPTRDLTHVIDTSGAFIPGHGTPTVILLSRDQAYQGQTRALLGIRGEPGRPENPATAKVWSAITGQVDKPGSESGFISVEDVADGRFFHHPWSLQGGAAPLVKRALEEGQGGVLEACIDSSGVLSFTGEDPLFADFTESQLDRLGIEDRSRRGFVEGFAIRDWALEASRCVFPYSPSFDAELLPGVARFLWPYRAGLRQTKMFQKTKEERGKLWFEWNFIMPNRLRVPMGISFSFVGTHNHFVFDRGGKIFKQSAPVIKLPERESEEEHFALLGLLNSSAGCFWMKQVFHNKGEGGGARVDAGYSAMGAEEWRNTFEFDSTKLKKFPIPVGAPTERARTLDDLAGELARVLPVQLADRQAPTSKRLAEAREAAETLRGRMVAAQEEMDWECYRLYGLIDQDLTIAADELPVLEKGQRPFAIALARRMAAGKTTTTWFERHGATPVTELPDHWSGAYRKVVERRLELIESDRVVNLLERPEYKRRWYWESFDKVATQAQERWLLDRIESWLSSQEPGHPEPTTVGRLADRLAADDEARQVAEDLEGTGTDLLKLVDRLVRSAGVAYLAAHRLKPSGLRKRSAWEHTWQLQRHEDEIDARAQLPEDHPQHLSESEAAVAKKEARLDKIPVPPKYVKGDFRGTPTWNLRGKLDVPKERFVLYPETRVGADTSLVVGWAGWDHLQQARVLAGLYTSRSQDGAKVAELGRLLAGLWELVPWLKQWHNEPDPTYGERMGQFFEAYVTAECSTLGLTTDDLVGGAPLNFDA